MLGLKAIEIALRHMHDPNTEDIDSFKRIVMSFRSGNCSLSELQMNARCVLIQLTDVAEMATRIREEQTELAKINMKRLKQGQYPHESLDETEDI